MFISIGLLSSKSSTPVHTHRVLPSRTAPRPESWMQPRSARGSCVRARSAPPTETTTFSLFRTSGPALQPQAQRVELLRSSLPSLSNREPVAQQFSSTVANTLNSLAPSAFLFSLSGKIFPLMNQLQPAPKSRILPKNATRRSRFALPSNAEKRITGESSYHPSPISYLTLLLATKPPARLLAALAVSGTHTAHARARTYARTPLPQSPQKICVLQPERS